MGYQGKEAMADDGNSRSFLGGCSGALVDRLEPEARMPPYPDFGPDDFIAIGIGSESSPNFWRVVQLEAEEVLEKEPHLFGLLSDCVLEHETLDAALSSHLAQKLATENLDASILKTIFNDAFSNAPSLRVAAQADLIEVRKRDPACKNYLAPLLFFSGFLALQAHRIAHWLWRQDREDIAVLLQSRISEIFGIDIHPAAHIGPGVMIDHGIGVVICDNAVVEGGVALLHEVSIGSAAGIPPLYRTKICSGSLIGAGACILGDIEVGICSRVGAGSVVLSDVAPSSTVVGVPTGFAWFADRTPKEAMRGTEPETLD
jgi:serine O-acetyltransferase